MLLASGPIQNILFPVFLHSICPIVLFLGSAAAQNLNSTDWMLAEKMFSHLNYIPSLHLSSRTAGFRDKHLFHRDLHFMKVSSHLQIQRVKSERRINLLKELGL